MSGDIVITGPSEVIEVEYLGPTNFSISLEVIGPRGVQGKSGLIWVTGGWVSGNIYTVDNALYRDGTSYRAFVEHTAAGATEPGVGEDWQTVWEVLALGSAVDKVDAVLAIEEAIESVADHEDDIELLASIAAEIEAAVANEAAIQAAPGHAAAAATSETNAAASEAKAEKWAEEDENTEVETGQYSAKHHALKAATSEANAATSAALEDAGVAIYHSTAIDLGGYFLDIAARVDQEITDVYAKVLGTSGDEMDFYLAIDGEMVYGPVTVTYGTDFHAADLEIERNQGEALQLFATYKVGNPTDLMVKTVGHAQS
jgi:hypothetical protein